MTIDCFVMPLWRFFAGDVSTAAQRIAGGAIRRVIMDDSPRIETPAHSTTQINFWRAKLKVRDFKRCVYRECGQRIDWHDAGNIAYQSQYHHDDMLNLYIAWRSCRAQLPSYEVLLHCENGLPGWRLVNQLGEWKPVYPHLYGLGFANSIAVPDSLSSPVKIWPQEHFWGISYTRVHSGTNALLDIEKICEELSIDDNFKAWEADWKNKYSGDWGLLLDGAATMRHILRLGVQYKLPVIFW